MHEWICHLEVAQALFLFELRNAHPQFLLCHCCCCFRHAWLLRLRAYINQYIQIHTYLLYISASAHMCMFPRYAPAAAAAAAAADVPFASLRLRASQLACRCRFQDFQTGVHLVFLFSKIEHSFCYCLNIFCTIILAPFRYQLILTP